jgi:hypothetical protein
MKCIFFHLYDSYEDCLYDNKLTQCELHMQSFQRGRHNLATMRSVYTLGQRAYKHFVFAF